MFGKILPYSGVGGRRHESSGGAAHGAIAMVLKIGVPDDLFVESDFEAHVYTKNKKVIGNSWDCVLTCRRINSEIR